MKKIEDAGPMRNKFVLEHDEFSAGLDVKQVAEWSASIELWEKDASMPNPYQRTLKSESLATVALFRVLTLRQRGYST